MSIFKRLIIKSEKTSVRQSTGLTCQNERAKVSPAIIRLISQLGLLGLLWMMTEAVMASQIPTTPAGTWNGTGTTAAATKDTPSGLRTTVSISGSGMTMGTRNNTSLQRSNTVTVPNLPTATNGIQILATANSNCVNTSLTCNNLGTVTFDFTDAAGNPIKVKNPVIHMSRLGERTGNTNFGAVLSLTTPASGTSLGIASGARGFTVAGNKISPDLSSFSTSSIGTCSTTSIQAGCGSIPVTGLVSSLSFNVDLVRNDMSTNWRNSSGVGATDGIYFTVSFDEDYGDAPATFDPTTIAAASHIVSDLTLGATIDADNTGVINGGATNASLVRPSPNAVAAGADNNGVLGDGADEDAISTFPALTTRSTSYALTVPITGASRAGEVCGWIDLNRNNIFDNPAERACSSFTSGATDVVLNWTGLSGLTAGNNFVRLRASYDTVGGESPTGRLNSGEVEDYQIAIIGYDYGDAPDSYGTNSNDNIGEGVGANHAILNNLKLGTNAPDAETDAKAPLDGTGDGTDEDGITTFPSLNISNTSYSLTATVSNSSGSAANVYAWIDFDRDGKFDGDERATVSNGTITLNSGKVPTGSNGTVTLTWNNLGGTGANIASGKSYARIRLTTDNLSTSPATNARDPSSVGNAINGEVEDYRIAIASPGNPPVPGNFCQASVTPRNLLFILDDSGSVDATERQQQRDAVMFTLNDFVAKNLTGQAAIVRFATSGGLVIGYTDITTANLSTFQTALGTQYGVVSGSTNWEAGFQAGIALGVDKPDIVFFFTDGTVNAGGSPDDDSNAFKNAGAHIYGIGIQGLTVDSGFRGITNGANTITYNGLNALEADFLPITDYGALQNQYTNAFLANLCRADFGDAPDTYGTNNIANNSSNNSEPLGANHKISPGLFLGATVPDTDANGFVDGTENNSNATDDDAPVGTGAGNGDDEDNLTFPTLKAGKTKYTIPASNITVTNTTGQPAKLHVWIDFDKNGKFDSTEYASAVVGTSGSNPQANLVWTGISVGTVGNTYARFRLTSDNNINNNTPGGNAKDGEVEDYQIVIAQASDPNLLLVKRITAINPGQPGAIQFNNFVEDADDNSDDNSLWPDSNSNHNDNINTYLRGVSNSSVVKPGDEVEYTIYFLSTGDMAAKDVKICDAVPDHMTFVKNTYGVELGIGLGFDSTTIPLTPNLKLSNLLNDDQGDFYAPSTAPPAELCKKVDSAYNLIPVNGANNDNGAIVVKIQDLPKANTPGSPTNSYGFIRFRTRIK